MEDRRQGKPDLTEHHTTTVPAIPVIIGPTASGKTGLSLKLAHALSTELGRVAEIVSADSRQVYSGMDIGTAKPGIKERQGIPHHLLDIVTPDINYTAGMFAVDARKCIHQILERGNVPVVVGGSGFYVQALFEGLSAPPADPKVYVQLEERMEHEGYEALYAELYAVDPIAARAHSQNNRVKTLRALACYLQTGKPYSSYSGDSTVNEQGAEPATKFRAKYLGLNPPRPELYERINSRVLEMINDGLVEEARALLDTGYTATSPGMRTVGYAEAICYLNGELGHGAMVSAIQQATRRYAKRQVTWFKRVDEVHWLEGPDLQPAFQWFRTAIEENSTRL